jgi:hypothetical protein
MLIPVSSAGLTIDCDKIPLYEKTRNRKKIGVRSQETGAGSQKRKKQNPGKGRDALKMKRAF